MAALVHCGNLRTAFMTSVKTKDTCRLLNIKSTNFKLGYPDFLVNQDEVDTLYNQLQINGSDYMGNVLRLNRYSKTQWNRELREGEDRSRWFYRPFDTGIAVLWYWNQIVVPAGILQFPFYDLEMPHYYSFGSFGSILAHFMIHVVDEWGSRWDKDGELMKDESGWWTNATRSAYTDVKQCVIDAYINKTQGPVVGPSGDTEYLPLNPAFVATEALTITSGIRLSYQAYQLWQSQKGREQAAPSGRGLTNEQLFFVASAQTYCFNTDNDILYWRFRRGSFVAGNTRVNMAVSQLDEFSQSFRCSPTSKMSPPNKCTVY